MKCKKTASMILASAMLLGLLAGCGGGSDSASPAAESSASAPTAAPVEETDQTPAAEESLTEASLLPQEAEASAQEEAAAKTAPEPEDYTLSEEGETLSLWYPAAGAFQNMIDYSEQARLKETEALTGVHIDLVLANMENANQTLNLMAASGDFPDMIQNPNMVTGGVTAAVENEMLMPLNDLYDEFMPHYKAIRESLSAYEKDSKLEDGTLPMAYAFYKEGYGINLGPVIRQDWLDDLNLDAPVTYDDYHDVLTAFKNDKGADAALWIPYTGTVSGYLVAGYQIGGEMLCRDGEVLYGPVTDEYKEYLEMMKQWYSEGLIYSDFATYTASEQYAPDELISHDRTGIFYSTAAMMTEFEGKSTSGMTLTAIGDAVQNVGDKNHVCHNYSLVLGIGTGISTTCSDPELAAQWLNFQYTQKGFMLNNYGEEGVSYELDAEGNPHFTDLITSNPDGLPLPIAIEKYACMSGPFVNDYTRMYAGYTDAQKEASDIWTATSDNEWMVANVPLETEESTEYNAALAEVSTYSAAQVAKFITGEADLDTEWDEYVSTCQSLGVDTMIDIYTDAVARYNAA